MALMKLCKCGTKVPINKSRCDKCEKAYNNRDKIYSKKGAVNNKKRDEYDSFYGSKAWKRVKEFVKSRDNGLCLLCLSKDKLILQTCVHHIYPIKEIKELSLEPSNLICLCDRCHKNIHKEYKTLKRKDCQIKLWDLVNPRGIGKV